MFNRRALVKGGFGGALALLLGKNASAHIGKENDTSGVVDVGGPYVRNTFYDVWYGHDGTRFEIEPMVKIDGLEHYSFKAYIRHEYRDEFVYLPAYNMRRSYVLRLIMDMGWDNFADHLRHEGREFEHEFYRQRGK